MDLKNVRLPIISRIIPNILAHEILSVQPMSPPTGLIFTMTKNRFGKPMAEPKYKFTRSNWHIVNTRWKWNWTDSDEVFRWCVANFGRCARNPDAWSRWYQKSEVYYFRDSDDCILFKLRWGV
jgi:hypothetical protein